MDRESIKEAFFQLKTRDDVASILGISERSLRYFLYKIRPENMYHIFKVPKKDGATREIAAPEKRLKKIQRKLADVLSAVYEPRVCAYGFITEKSNIGNAAQHVKKSLVFNIDLKDFFSQIHFGRVRGIKVHVCMTPTILNYQKLNGVIELCLQLGVSCFNLSQFVPVGRGSVELDLPPIAWKQIMHIWKEKN